MKNIAVILAGLPGDMATRVKKVIDETEGIVFARTSDDYQTCALTGDTIKGQPISDEFCKEYSRINGGINLIKPPHHEDIIKRLRESENNLFGINFATAEGYGVNFMFVKYGIPFISGVTGAPKEEEDKLVEAVENSGINAIIDKNMNPALVVMGAMLKYAAENFPGALDGFNGYGVDSHQRTKKDNISGTLVKWTDYFKELGVNFVPVQGDRTGIFGHGYHDIRLMNPDGTVELDLGTRVLGRESYAQATVQKALPYLVNDASIASIKGRVLTMEDVLRGE